MPKKLAIYIKETPQELRQLLHQQKNSRIKERVQILYLLKTQQSQSALEASIFIGRDYSTIKRWLRVYRQKGLAELLELKHGGGRSLSLNSEILNALCQRLQKPSEFKSYESIQIWLRETYGIQLCYSTLHGIVHNRLKTRL